MFIQQVERVIEQIAGFARLASSESLGHDAVAAGLEVRIGDCLSDSPRTVEINRAHMMANTHGVVVPLVYRLAILALRDHVENAFGGGRIRIRELLREIAVMADILERVFKF